MTCPKALFSDLTTAAQVARGLAMDTVALAQSGHLGLPLGCAEIGAVLFGNLLRLNPQVPRWKNRDRFILSAGHGSVFLYSWLYLSGFALDPLSQFRTQGSNLPGHPEFGLTPGVECTTGPLGQGIANAVGFAVAEKMQRSRLPQTQKIFNYRIVCLCSDGDLQEGISHEACSLAGHLRLNRLIIIYDANGVTIDGPLDQSQSEDVAKRFQAYGFFVQTVDGHDLFQLIRAYQWAKRSAQPNLIIAKTVIGQGLTEVAGTSKAHGEGAISLIPEAKKALHLPSQSFYVDQSVKRLFQRRRNQWAKTYAQWLRRCDDAKRSYDPEILWILEDAFPQNDACSFTDRSAQHPSKDTAKHASSACCSTFSDTFASEYDPENALKNPSLHLRKNAFASHTSNDHFTGNFSYISMREMGGKILNQLACENPRIITGSADLFNSNKNYLIDQGDFSATNGRGRNIHFGIREHAMGAILNGIAYDGIFQPSGATFLVFSDYLRPAIRSAAMAKLPVVYIFTHDSIAVGSDGPTHQPVELLCALRAIPNLDVIRPADDQECIEAYRAAFSRKEGPTALILPRQDLPSLNIQRSPMHHFMGAYIAHKETHCLQAILIATGSELSLALNAIEGFKENIRVVSMPSMEIFERQSVTYKQMILPDTCSIRLAIEAGIATPWYNYVGSSGRVIAVSTFGFSAPGKVVQEHFGFTVERIREAIRDMISV
ncbi:MAG: transketolase [Puniceicoccales bacterium]|jgi:transketolase|nr:transketolase [Puniceicoccales bacterium]